MSYIILPTKADVQYKYMYIHTNFIIVWPCRSTYCKYNVPGSKNNSMRLAAAVRHTKCERETEGKKLQGRNNYETLWTNHSTKMISEPNESEPNCGVASLTCCLA